VFSLLFLWANGGLQSPPGYATGHNIPQCRLDMNAQLNYKSRKVMLSV